MDRRGKNNTHAGIFKGVHDMYDIRIKTPNGHMTIHLQNFFPATTQKLKKLIKIISLDWQHRFALMEKMKVFVRDEIETAKGAKRYYARMYQESRQTRVDLETQVSSRKYTNGVPIPKEVLKTKKNDIRHFRNLERDALASFHKCEKDIEKLNKNLEVLTSVQPYES